MNSKPQPAVHAEVGAAEAPPHFEADWVLALHRANELWVSWLRAFPGPPKTPAHSAFGAAFEAAGGEALESAAADAAPRRT